MGSRSVPGDKVRLDHEHKKFKAGEPKTLVQSYSYSLGDYQILGSGLSIKIAENNRGRGEICSWFHSQPRLSNSFCCVSMLSNYVSNGSIKV